MSVGDPVAITIHCPQCSWSRVTGPLAPLQAMMDSTHRALRWQLTQHLRNDAAFPAADAEVVAADALVNDRGPAMETIRMQVSSKADPERYR